MQSEEEPVKRIYILAGPNGAGKTTFAREFLTHEANCLSLPTSIGPGFADY